jgi:hypothetical protein
MQRRTLISRLAGLVIVFVLTSGFGGCRPASRYQPVRLAQASGIVLEGGDPVERVRVVLHPVNPPPGQVLLPVATTNEDGIFHLTTYENGDGAPPGDYRVVITCPVLANPQAKGLQPPVDKYKGRYADPEKSPWTVTIEEGVNELEPFIVDVK